MKIKKSADKIFNYINKIDSKCDFDILTSTLRTFVDSNITNTCSRENNTSFASYR